MKLNSSERSQQLAEQNGWSLAYAQGYMDGESLRRLGKALAPHARVGIDEYSLGFRAGYFERQNVDARVERSAPMGADETGQGAVPLPRSVPATVDPRFHRTFLAWFR